ncbi:hypothetical protein CC78DRAFT_228399 [Lojkania enalia]|uniref:Uncharacterized protein n=1 Tax=Lojkania enalia TaxID=147567 RepID=A0A9P4K821_9PLEO|nr:hypothetical protein CC78DRAFT_228399 [Didymosphaeria enalia]
MTQNWGFWGLDSTDGRHLSASRVSLGCVDQAGIDIDSSCAVMKMSKAGVGNENTVHMTLTNSATKTTKGGVAQEKVDEMGVSALCSAGWLVGDAGALQLSPRIGQDRINQRPRCCCCEFRRIAAKYYQLQRVCGLICVWKFASLKRFIGWAWLRVPMDLLPEYGANLR